MEKERKITATEGCEIEKVEIVDGVAVVTFREKKRKLPKSWEEFCEMYDVSDTEYFIDDVGGICNAIENKAFISRDIENDKNVLPDRATAEAVLALCQLIQLRNAYNGDWVPDWEDGKIKYFIEFCNKGIQKNEFYHRQSSPLYFKTEELRDEFLRNFRPLIEKLKPLYGIK
jgi:hypothetical protein